MAESFRNLELKSDAFQVKLKGKVRGLLILGRGRSILEHLGGNGARLREFRGFVGNLGGPPVRTFEPPVGRLPGLLSIYFRYHWDRFVPSFIFVQPLQFSGVPSPEKTTGTWASRASLTRPITRWRVRARVTLDNFAIFFKMLRKLFQVLLCKNIFGKQLCRQLF